MTILISVKDLLLADDNEKIADIMETNIISVHTHEDKEEVAMQFSKYDFLAMPVVDNENRLVLNRMQQHRQHRYGSLMQI